MTPVNITMLTYGRPRLLAQALDSLNQNTAPDSYILTTLNDEAQLGTGPARNQVITLASDHRRGSLLYLSDNDVYFPPRWLPALVEAFEYAHEHLDVVALGAYNHPYNQPVRRWPFFSTVLGRTLSICEVHALALQSWLWRWEDWDRFGPFDQTPPGRVRMSEDFAVSQKIRAVGGRVATLLPPLIVNCGRTDSFGQPIPGSDLIHDIPGVIVE